MSQRNHYTFGRALVDKRRRRRKDLAAAVQRLVNSSSRFSFLPRAYPYSNLTANDESLKHIPKDSDGHAKSFLMGYYDGPMPALQLANGQVPLKFDPALQGDQIYGELKLDGLSDPRTKQIWKLLQQQLHAYGWFQWSVKWPGQSSFLTISCTPKSDEEDRDLEIRFTWMRDEHDLWSIEEYVDSLGLRSDEFESTREQELVSTEGHRGTNTRAYRNVSLPEAIHQIDSLIRNLPSPWEPSEDIDVLIAAKTGIKQMQKSQYAKLRPKMNKICNSWTTSFNAFYQDEFDPIVDPIEIPDEVGELRFPVIIQGASGPQLQVDVVYREDYSFLEFITSKSARTLRKYAQSAEADLEMWSAEERYSK